MARFGWGVLESVDVVTEPGTDFSQPWCTDSYRTFLGPVFLPIPAPTPWGWPITCRRESGPEKAGLSSFQSSSRH